MTDYITVGYCHIATADIIFKCSCGKYELGYEICRDCGNSEPILRHYEGLMKLMEQPVNMFNAYSVKEIKEKLPKTKHKKSKSIVLTASKRGRSNYVSADVVDYFIANRLYDYFSLMVGKTKV